MTDLVIIADDLTGAGDSATLFAERATTGITLDAAAPWPDLPVLAVDTDSRYRIPTEAAGRVAAAAERARGLGARVYKKIDSLLRGNVAAEVAAAARALGSATALPWPLSPRPFPPPGGPPWRGWCWCTASRCGRPSTAASPPCWPRRT